VTLFGTEVEWQVRTAGRVWVGPVLQADGVTPLLDWKYVITARDTAPGTAAAWADPVTDPDSLHPGYGVNLTPGLLAPGEWRLYGKDTFGVVWLVGTIRVE
jgi:hypothetical protein